MATSVQVALPKLTHRRPFPVLYLLHGLSDDDTIWFRRTNVERYATERGLAVVCPAVQRSFYQDTAAGMAYWTYLSEELPRLCTEYFPNSARREDTFACGFSMGGYGAFRLALAKPERYAAAASLAGVLVIEKRAADDTSETLLPAAERRGIFGLTTSAAGSPADLRFLATQLAQAGGPRPRLLQHCGTEDFLYEDNQIFRQHVAPLGLDWTYQESPGGHNWEYAETAIRGVLDWIDTIRS